MQSWTHEEQQEDPCVTKILKFLAELNIAIPSSRRKLIIKSMLRAEKAWSHHFSIIPFFYFQPIINIVSTNSYLSSHLEG